MEWEVEFTDQFNAWWEGLTEAEQEDIDAVVRVLEQRGPALRRPHVGTIDGSRHANMKELTVQHSGRPYRILFAFDPRRCAILLIGGDKTDNNRWYQDVCPSPMNSMMTTWRRCGATSKRTARRTDDGEAVSNTA